MKDLPRKRMGSGVLFTDDADRVLLVEPTYKPYWEVPGGAVEADESPYDTARREIAEELGLVVVPGQLLAVDYVSRGDVGAEGLMLLFDGGVLTPAETATIEVPADELRGWAWCDEREAALRLSPLLARRVTAAIAAKAAGNAVYLEDGRPR